MFLISSSIQGLSYVAIAATYNFLRLRPVRNSYLQNEHIGQAVARTEYCAKTYYQAAVGFP